MMIVMVRVNHEVEEDRDGDVDNNDLDKST